MTFAAPSSGLRWGAVLAVQAMVAWGALASPPSKRVDDDAKRCRAAIADGRKAERGGDHAAATAAFERAAALRPGDAAVLSELGWSAYQAKDLTRAEQATRAAIAAAKDYASQRVKAASLYNLGRILEDKGQRPGAVEAYLGSLALRPSRTVREQLAKLDPQAALDADPLKPVAMLGPFATFEATCDALGDENRSRAHCPHSDFSGGELKLVGKPWLAVRYFLEADEMTCHLAVRLASGWYFD